MDTQMTMFTLIITFITIASNEWAAIGGVEMGGGGEGIVCVPTFTALKSVTPSSQHEQHEGIALLIDIYYEKTK